jgi:2,3-bisphosphoglycerate-independent phosphoglycerate mutase
MRILFMFLDGVGLGSDDPFVNPFVRANVPNLTALLAERKFLADSAPLETERATLLSVDACLGVDGLPQSATGQAVLLTGRNIPAEIGYHYGPKPDQATAATLQDGGIFGALTRAGKRAALINAYPAGYFHGINSGKRLYSSIPLAVTNAGLSLRTTDDLLAGRAISADFTGQGWRDRLGHPEIPLLSPVEAGKRLAELSASLDFAFFEYWLTDYAGHEQDLEAAIRLLEHFDVVLGGLLDAWDDENGLILLTSDHGNLEDVSTRRHTANPVPLLLVGNARAQEKFAGVSDLTGVAPAILAVLNS